MIMNETPELVIRIDCCHRLSMSLKLGFVPSNKTLFDIDLFTLCLCRSKGLLELGQVVQIFVEVANVALVFELGYLSNNCRKLFLQICSALHQLALDVHAVHLEIILAIVDVCCICLPLRGSPNCLVVLVCKHMFLVPRQEEPSLDILVLAQEAGHGFAHCFLHCSFKLHELILVLGLPHDAGVQMLKLLHQSSATVLVSQGQRLQQLRNAVPGALLKLPVDFQGIDTHHLHSDYVWTRVMEAVYGIQEVLDISLIVLSGLVWILQEGRDTILLLQEEKERFVELQDLLCI
mmetsp:Transcript_68390/g.120791  ORF Transcript_68390/g.120791 Transcript_68390/m.120791 type:complete len:291 (+) Transcript_68390:2089-2961(+)